MKLLLIGELCKDRFTYCNCNRLCPEAPVPILNPLYTEENDGMAGNVYNNLKALYQDIDIKFLHQDKLIFKNRYVDIQSGQTVIRIDENDLLEDELKIDILNNLLNDSFDGVLISDYDKGFINEEIIEYISNAFKCPIFLDTKKILGEWSKNIHFIKINELEFKNNYKLSNDNLLNYGKNIIITKGENGAVHLNSNSFVKQKYKNNNIIKYVSGCGDTFFSAFCIDFLKNGNIINSIEYANYIASLVVKEKGVVIPKI